MILKACKYGAVTRHRRELSVQSIKIDHLAPHGHFFRPILILTEHRRAWGNDSYRHYESFDIQQGLNDLPTRFRNGSQFFVRVRFVLFLQFAIPPAPEWPAGLWTHLPTDGSTGIVANGKNREAIVHTMSELKSLDAALEFMSNKTDDVNFDRESRSILNEWYDDSPFSVPALTVAPSPFPPIANPLIRFFLEDCLAEPFLLPDEEGYTATRYASSELKRLQRYSVGTDQLFLDV